MRDFILKRKKNRAIAKEAVLFIFFACFAVLLCVSGKSAEFTVGGIGLWANMILPALFPYFFITAALGKLGVTEKLAAKLSPVTEKVFNLPGIVSYAIFTSFISGYPIGAKIVSDLKNNKLITETESVRASALCSVASPAFIIGGIGGAFSSVNFGIALFCSHLLSAILTGVLFSFYKRKERPTKPARQKSCEENADNILYECAYSAVISILTVGGIITIFYVITELLCFIGAFDLPIRILQGFFGEEYAAKGAVLGFFEFTKGINALKVAGATKTAFILSAAICGFGGLSVIFQSLAYLKKAKIKTVPFILSKMLGAVINAVMAFIVYSLFF